MPKKIIILLMLICLHITASIRNEEEVIRNKGPFIEHISTGLPKKIAMAATIGFWASVDAATMLRVLPSIVNRNLFSMMTSSAAVLLPEVLEGPLTNKKWSAIIANGFCAASILIFPETAIGSYAFAYIVNETAKYCKIDPINRATLSYFGGRLGAMLSQSFIPADLSFLGAYSYIE
ncbi:MAG: hypothetical protein NT128_03865 [Proteobacteria bacterium]|nr:hypothetical protein [Pseudomonadota bacterium]